MDSQAWAFLFTAKWRTFNVYREVYNYVIISLIIVGNLLTLIALVRCRHLHVQRNWLIGSLCLADIMVAVTCAVTMFLTGRDVWDLRVTAMNVAFFISFFHVLIIAADRFIAITVPLRYFTIVTKRSIIVMIAIAWLVPALVLIPVYEVTSLQGQMTNGRYYVNLAHRVVNIIMSILLIGTIVVLYGKILKETRSHVRRINMVKPITNTELCETQWTSQTRVQRASNQETLQTRNQGISKEEVPQARNQKTSNQEMPGASNQELPKQEMPDTINQATSNQETKGTRKQGTSNQVVPGARNQRTSNQVTPGVRNQGTSNQVAPGARKQIISNQVTPGARNQRTSNQGAPQASKKGTRLILTLVITMRRLVRCRHLHVQRNWLIGSLCLADIMVAVTSMMYGYLYENDVWDWRVTAMNVAFFISFFHVIIIAADRFIAITVPLRYFTIVTKRSIVMMIAIAWILPALVLIPLYEVTLLQGQMTNGRYYVHYTHHVVSIVSSMLLITIAALYGKILKETRSHVRKINNMVQPMNNTERSETQARKRGISNQDTPPSLNQGTSNQNMPHNSNQGTSNQEAPRARHQETHNQRAPPDMKKGTRLILTLLLSVNILVYSIFSYSFRRAYKELLCCLCSRTK